MADEQHTDPDFDRRQGDPVFHEQAPADSGSAGSFATRHNEFPPGEGHDAAAHDPSTGAPVHGDGTPNAELPAQWAQGGDADQDGASGLDPAAQETQEGEIAHGEHHAGGQAREAHPEPAQHADPAPGEPER
ncbi:hypothetical protein [Agrococcus sp. ARC_14]|uniref:hypothetical protein n=1 Tax=Agrococcus sp. ARC_14 TaxID=2919927 RepID=UPI001F056A62|nr:hypothetical protein [Agrococcus sp. ARC_14]MCH1882512.1 hypothetical protein [Agrococcus sp. ARC_14]